jgi:hypothetical protein
MEETEGETLETPVEVVICIIAVLPTMTSSQSPMKNCYVSNSIQRTKNSIRKNTVNGDTVLGMMTIGYCSTACVDAKSYRWR